MRQKNPLFLAGAFYLCPVFLYPNLDFRNLVRFWLLNHRILSGRCIRSHFGIQIAMNKCWFIIIVVLTMLRNGYACTELWLSNAMD